MKQKICTALDVIQKMNRKYELRTLESKTAEIQKRMDDFCLKVLFVGGFSAGKSALINAIIGEEILQEGQRPETAIACEIVYDTKEYVEAIKGDRKVQYDIGEMASIDVKEYDYLILHMPCEEIGKYRDCTLVDMPGFNSGISDHNKAILQYAGKGNAYLLIIDCEDGAIKRSISTFLDEIKNYENNIAIVVTKCDLKTEDDIIKIKNNIAENARLYLGSDVSVVTTSKYDENAKDKLEILINKFDREELFRQEFAPQVYEDGMRCIDSIETYKRSMRLDLSQFDEEIAKHERTKKTLSDKLKKEKGKLEVRFRNSVEPAIISDIQKALYSRVDELATSLKSGEHSFSMTVNSILRPVLLSSTQRYVEQSFDDFITEIDLSNMDIDSSVQRISENAVEKYQQMNNKMQEMAQKGDKFNAVYKTITTALAVATNVVAPWLELIIIFLPNILKLFGMGNKGESLNNKVNNEIIPQIVSRMQPEIEKSLMEMKEDMIQKVEEEIGELIDTEMESLESARDAREKASVQYDEKLNEIQRDIDEIENTLKGIA